MRPLTWLVLITLLVLQGFHMVEHAVQLVQYHLFRLHPVHAHGIISRADREWIHFVWNWAVLATVVYLMAKGMRNRWAWALLAVAVGHSLEHLYLVVRFLAVRSELGALGLPAFAPEGLAGIFGRDGWLARSPLTAGTFLGTIPGLTTASRIHVHFWWNVLEVGFLIPASAPCLRQLVQSLRQRLTLV